MTVFQPDMTLNIIAATETISNADQRVLFIGQQTSSGSATSGELVTGIGNANEEDALFGATSMLAQTIRQYKRINQVTQTDVIPLDDNGSGTAATGTVAFTGTATATGSITLSIGSKSQYALAIAITSGDTASVVGDTVDTAVALVAAIDAPFTSSNSTGTVTVTCVHKGEIGNDFGLRVDGAVAGITVALTAFSSGATNPVLTNLFDVIDNERYQTIIWPNTFTLATLTTELDARFNVNNSILDGVGITYQMDTFANLQTAGAAENSLSLALGGNKKLTDTAHKGGAILEFNDVLSANVGAIRSLRLTPDANIAQFIVSTNGARDSFGGVHMASFPYFNTPFANLPLIGIGKGFTIIETEALKTTSGVFTLSNNKTRTTILADEIVTTRKTDAAGNPELTFKFLNAVDTSSNIREFFINNLKATYAQSRLTAGDLVPGHNMANQESIEAFLDGKFRVLSEEGFVLTRAGEAALNFFKANRSVTLDLINGKVTVNMKVQIVVQFRILIGTIQIDFSAEG